MADELAELEEGVEGAEDRRTMTYMMEHPEDAPAFKAVQPQAEPEIDESESGPEPQLEPVQTEETEEEKAAREATPPEFAPKHKSWEETEKARVEAEKLITARAEEAKTEREKREALEAKIAEQERLAVEAAKPKPLTEDEQDEIFTKAAAELADLDQNDPDYLKNYGKIWRKAIGAAGQHRTPPDPENTAEVVAQKAWEKFQTKQAEENAKTAEQREQENRERINQQANDFAKQAGLNMVKGSADYRLFWDIANHDLATQDFMKGDNPPDLEEQFKWVVNEAKRLTGQVVEQTDVEREQARTAQKNNAVLGKGVQVAPAQEPPKTRTMSEMMLERASLGQKL